MKDHRPIGMEFSRRILRAVLVLAACPCAVGARFTDTFSKIKIARVSNR